LLSFFEFQLTEDYPAGLLTMKIEAILDGWRVIMKSIAQGNHEVFFKEVLLDAAPICSTDFATDVAHYIRANPN
jgi:hypothetical protein